MASRARDWARAGQSEEARAGGQAFGPDSRASEFEAGRQRGYTEGWCAALDQVEKDRGRPPTDADFGAAAANAQAERQAYDRGFAAGQASRWGRPPDAGAGTAVTSDLSERIRKVAAMTTSSNEGEADVARRKLGELIRAELG